MFGQLLGPEIEALIKEKNFVAIKEIFSDFAPVDLAELISELKAEDRVVVFRLLPHDLAGSTFEYLNLEDQKSLLEAMGQEDAVKIINDMSPDDRTALLEELPSSAVTGLLKLLKPDQLSVAKQLLGYPEKSVGRLMTPDFIAIYDDWTVKEVLDHVRQHGHDSETLNVLYVIDKHGNLIDDVRIREFLIHPLETRVKDIRDSSFIALKVTDLEKDVVQLFKKYDRTVLPVVDSEGRLVGIVTIDDIIDVAEKAATEDIQKLGGSEALDEPYNTIPFWRMVKKRASWLIVLFLGEMLTATAMGSFEEEIERAVVLALFVPLIISSGGNSGSQASTLIIRAMALGEVTLRNWWIVMRKEIMAGLTLGSILGLIGFFRIAIWSYFSSIYGEHWFLVALTVSFSLVGIVLWGTLSGSMLPFILRKCRLDPATSSAPFVATLVDVTGLVIYFSVATVILHSSLLVGPQPGVVKLGVEKTTRSMRTLLHLPMDWEATDVSYFTNENKVVVQMGGVEDFAYINGDRHLSAKKCPDCEGNLSRGGARERLHRWLNYHQPHANSVTNDYLNLFDSKTQIVTDPPILICEKCGKSFYFLPPLLNNTNTLPIPFKAATSK
ncbi:MAG: Mg2+ transporter MgtE [Verrucomicrobiales bacterium]|nr:Mg2+ transporter MgtE [Verrucomicrobiales bacterium]